MDAGHVFNKFIPKLITMYITYMCTKILTSLLVPFPYKNADTALCIKVQDTVASEIDQAYQRLVVQWFGDRILKEMYECGSFTLHSSTTISQLKFFAASWVSNKIESCFSERITACQPLSSALLHSHLDRSWGWFHHWGCIMTVSKSLHGIFASWSPHFELLGSRGVSNCDLLYTRIW